MRVGKTIYVMPFIFTYTAMLSWNTPVAMLFDFAGVFLAFALFPVVLEGFMLARMAAWERGVIALAIVCFFSATFNYGLSGWPWMLGGLFLFLGEFAYQRAAVKRAALAGSAG
jgi:TRAP-type uncharacterized transport system fused permease subunit